MSIQRINAQEAHEKMSEGVPYVDVRTMMEFEAGHPEGSYHIPFGVPEPRSGMMMLNPDFVPLMVAHFDKESPVLLGCKAGGRSAHAAHLLTQEGFTNLIDVGPGWSGGPDGSGQYAPGWANCGLPFSRGDGGERSFESLREALEED
jgi:rhodanese-related sulfurtransferase